MHSPRPYIFAYCQRLRINTICPLITQTRTALGKTLKDRWVEEGLNVNTSLGVAKVAAGVLVDDCEWHVHVVVLGNRNQHRPFGVSVAG